jgi:hypothetical protein
LRNIIISSQSLDESVFHAKNFEHLLYDSINLLYMSHDIDRETDEHDLERACARASIINTLLLFECAANCLVSALSFSRGLADDVDKLPFLSKFELCAGRIPGAQILDRGRIEVAAVVELKALRDAYVHPKVKKQKLVQVSEGHYETESKKTSQLSLSYNPAGWRREAAVSAARAANSFFNYLFLEACALTPDTVCEVLLDPSAASIPATSSTTIDCIGGLDRAVSKWGIDFAYLGKGA